MFYTNILGNQVYRIAAFITLIIVFAYFNVANKPGFFEYDMHAKFNNNAI